MRNKLSVLLLTFTTAFVAVPAAQAEPNGSDSLWQNDAGFSFEEGYVGALLGNNQTKSNLGINISNPDQSVSLKENFSASQSNFTGGILAGYGVTYQRGYFGMEVSTQPFPVNTTINHASALDQNIAVSDKITSYNIGNLDFIPGYYLTRSLLTYARVGVGANYYKFSRITAGTNELNGSSLAAGWRLGVGADWRIAQHFGLGVDYIYSRYFTSNLVDSTSGFNNLEKDINMSSQINNLIAAHLRYYF
jgi:opacity protein-like surface antigen